MAFRDNAYATVWEVKTTRGSSMNVRISTSVKDKKSGDYISDFGSYVFFAGDAAKKATNLKEKDRVQLLQTSVTSKYDKNTKQTSYTFYVWDFKPAEGGKNNKQSASVIPPKAPAIEENDDLPF